LVNCTSLLSNSRCSNKERALEKERARPFVEDTHTDDAPQSQPSAPTRKTFERSHTREQFEDIVFYKEFQFPRRPLMLRTPNAPFHAPLAVSISSPFNVRLFARITTRTTLSSALPPAAHVSLPPSRSNAAPLPLCRNWKHARVAYGKRQTKGRGRLRGSENRPQECRFPFRFLCGKHLQ